MNQNIVLIGGKACNGKSASLRNINNPSGVMYLNCENNKVLPFPDKFLSATILDPKKHMDEAFAYAEPKDDIHTIVIDTLTFLMDMYETQYVLASENTMQAWGEYAQYFKKLMNEKVAGSKKNIIILAHTSDIFNEKEMAVETMVKVKGSLMNLGIESYFGTVLTAKKLSLKALESYESKLLNITEEEELLGFKYVYQTRLTRDTVNERIRAPMGMWNANETFIDNDIQLVIDRLHTYFK